MKGEMTVSEAGSKGGSIGGRHNRGEGNPKSRLTWAAVETIRQERETPTGELAARYGVALNTIRAARRGATWRQR